MMLNLIGALSHKQRLKRLKDIYQCCRFARRKEVEFLSDYILLLRMMLTRISTKGIQPC
jgi:hypothetical protein